MVHTGRYDFKFFQYSKFTLKCDKPIIPSDTSVLHNFRAFMILMSSKDKSPEVPLHRITLSYSYFEEF